MTPYTFGDNSFGQLGNGTTTARLAPGRCPGWTTSSQLDGGREHVIALTAGGQVETWGHNQYGQLGTGRSAGSRTRPPWCLVCAGVIDVAAGHYHSMALRSDGSIWAWGYNATGQLGDGTTTNRGAPVRVPGSQVWSAIAGGRDMSYALRSDGTVWAWGLNTDGELGNGTTTSSTVPVRVGSLTERRRRSPAGRDHGLAVESDGSVWTWGWNALRPAGRRHHDRPAQRRSRS